jgi:hypothetical protein
MGTRALASCLDAQAMNYDLAKQLREAGLAQGGNGKWITPPDKIVARREDRVYVPTLSELIMACEDFRCLEKNRGTWVARTTAVTAEGVTPEEAVARLWLVQPRTV